MRLLRFWSSAINDRPAGETHGYRDKVSQSDQDVKINSTRTGLRRSQEKRAGAHGYTGNVGDAWKFEAGTVTCPVLQVPMAAGTQHPWQHPWQRAPDLDSNTDCTLSPDPSALQYPPLPTHTYKRTPHTQAPQAHRARHAGLAPVPCCTALLYRPPLYRPPLTAQRVHHGPRDALQDVLPIHAVRHERLGLDLACGTHANDTPRQHVTTRSKDLGGLRGHRARAAHSVQCLCCAFCTVLVRGHCAVQCLCEDTTLVLRVLYTCKLPCWVWVGARRGRV